MNLEIRLNGSLALAGDATPAKSSIKLMTMGPIDRGANVGWSLR